MFAGKAGDYPSEAPFRCTTLGYAPGPCVVALNVTLFIAILSVIMLSVVILSVFMLNAIKLRVTFSLCNTE
jgi:hypothetical protein